ncbi:hypothetical protein AVEN_174601-1 [Araneus ventricosus]|uniref:Uncharacterized protein n=1 Tax=Araneus ventricosus TaxID=182803 RepID=A0A4Y2S3L8_ARAVE|nr:hypothetical protein AVEN_99998-1 [Araneus ventricosus]GBN82571.1 hypothetical protein AVEN_234944-1 [Araneus ventricosus]GBN82608.1 hypothetical protein AVEN_173087-1 [Araneus ventricosus]GBN82610.1 hypothetical protein AVEN_174601-1 [Araneus ventricosus]
MFLQFRRKGNSHWAVVTPSDENALGMLDDGVILLHDNTHTVKNYAHKSRIAAKIQVGNLEPPHIQRRFGTQSGFHTLIRTKFSSNSDGKTGAESWLNG